MSVKREIDFYAELMAEGDGNELVKAFPKVIPSLEVQLMRALQSNVEFRRSTTATAETSPPTSPSRPRPSRSS